MPLPGNSEDWDKNRFEPYEKFANMIDKHLDGILVYCEKRVPLGYIEGTNLKARNITRKVYGHRDKEYMKPKIIKDALP